MPRKIIATTNQEKNSQANSLLLSAEMLPSSSVCVCFRVLKKKGYLVCMEDKNNKIKNGRCTVGSVCVREKWKNASSSQKETNEIESELEESNRPVGKQPINCAKRNDGANIPVQKISSCTI